MAVDHYENFPVASWLCPAAIRPAVRAVYAFARTADDIADEGTAAADERVALLDAYRDDLRAVFEGRPPGTRWPGVFSAIDRARREHGLPERPLADLLSAFRQDASNPRYETYAQLLDYCSRSASPVGRLMLHLYGIDEAVALRQSDDVCTALQLINFWQDLSVDLPRGRSYLPLEVLRKHGVESVPPADTPPSALAPVVADLCARARAQMQAGAPLARRVPGRAGWELRLVVQGGLRVLGRIEQMRYLTLGARPRLRPWDAPLMAWRAATMPA